MKKRITAYQVSMPRETALKLLKLQTPRREHPGTLEVALYGPRLISVLRKS